MFNRKGLAALTAALAVSTLVGSASASVVFQDNFEPTGAGSNATSLLGSGTTPDVSATTYTVSKTSQKVNSTLWVRGTTGYGSTNDGLVSSAGSDAGNFTSPSGTQAYASRYTNAGVTTAASTIGALAAGQTINVTFYVAQDGQTQVKQYAAGLVLFGAPQTNDRNDDSHGIAGNTAAVLAEATGNATTDGNWTKITLSYTVGDNMVANAANGGGTTAYDSSLLGNDIAFRYTEGGSGSSALLDNVSIDVTSIPEPGSLALLGLGGLLLVARRRRLA